jgi:hypothetical protein
MGIRFGELGRQQMGGQQLQQFGQAAAGAAARLGQHGPHRLFHPFILNLQMAAAFSFSHFMQRLR